MVKIYKLNEIDCPICAAKVEKRIEKIKGIDAVSVDYISQQIVVEADNIDEDTFDEIVLAVKMVDPDCEVIR